MATLKIKFRPSAVAGKEGSLYYLLTHRGKVRQISAGCRLLPGEWDDACGRIVTVGCATARLPYLAEVESTLNSDCRLFAAVIRRLERAGGDYDCDTLAEACNGVRDRGIRFTEFAHTVIGRMRKAGRVRLAETYQSSVCSFGRFLGEGMDVALDKVDADVMAGYENYLKASGLTLNTVSFYMRNLRAIYNRAVERGLVVQRNPFRHVYTGIDKTVKRAVSSAVIARIKWLNLSLSPSEQLARDLFLFSFYMRGMAFVDMAYLRKSDLQGGVLCYRRHKTKQQLFIKWEQPMQEIVDRYADAASPYLLPIIRRPGRDERRQYLNAIHLLNRKLKIIGQMAGSPVALTFHVARHGWASIARNNNVSLSVISEAMGHESENTTRIYLASLDTSLVDNANSVVINSIG